LTETTALQVGDHGSNSCFASWKRASQGWHLG
jgi:hypothetical protein